MNANGRAPRLDSAGQVSPVANEAPISSTPDTASW